ncbi:MAG: ParA family protein, partial [bacterium]|nr:ParA family protein [bacterium]
MIFTFVSYKGGVGRTRTLVHTGLRLADQVRELGLRVLLVDMDLDAPGFEPYFPEADLAAAGGVSALLSEYSTVPRGDRRGWLRDQLSPPAPDPRSRLIFTFEEASNLAVLPAGKASLVEGGFQRILETVLPELGRRSGKLPASDGLFGDFRAALGEHWDYVLIDARAGHAALTFASAIVLADVLVACFRLNQANLDGIRDIFGTFLAGGAAEEAQERRFHVIPVATPVPHRSGKDVVEWIEKATVTFYPETRNVDEDDGGDQAEPFDPLRGMLPRIHRIYEDAAARLGEWRFLQLDGKPAEGMDRKMPSYVAVEGLASHLRILNADHDVGGARAVEAHLYNKVGEKKKALTYWEKRARLQPQAAEIWSEFQKGYSASDDQDLRTSARETLGALIEQWRERLSAGSLESGISVLAKALLQYCASFGKERA